MVDSNRLGPLSNSERRLTPFLHATIGRLIRQTVAQFADFSGHLITTVEPIRTERGSGFIPTTDGGWSAEITFRFSGAKDVFDMGDLTVQDNALMRDQYQRDTGKIFDESTPEERETFREQWEEEDNSTLDLLLSVIFYTTENYCNTSGEDELYIYASAEFTKSKFERVLPLKDVLVDGDRLNEVLREAVDYLGSL